MRLGQHEVGPGLLTAAPCRFDQETFSEQSNEATDNTWKITVS